MTENARRADRERLAPDSIRKRFFYHSFPHQHSNGKGDLLSDTTIEQGLATLTGITEIGLLLTPERWSLPPEYVDDGSEPEDIPVYQKRVCFTAITPCELATHADYFGPFSLEFEIELVRRMGATPVIYIPTTVGTELDYGGAGVSMLHRLVEVRSILNRLQSMRDICGQQNLPNPIRMSLGTPPRYRQIRASTEGVLDVVEFVEDGIRDSDTLRATVDGLSSFMYPSEIHGSDHLLEYFQEKEWRITNAFVRSATGKGLHSELTTEEKARLTELSPDYFGRTIEMMSGEISVADGCLAIRSFDSRGIFELCRRVIVPARAVPAVNQILPAEARSKITAFETLPSGETA